MFGKKTKLTNGEMSFDDDLNFPDFEFDSQPIEDNRNPITQVKDGLKTGMKRKLADPATYMKLGRKILPDEFGETVDKIDKTVTSAKSVYDSAIKEVKPALADFAKAADKMVPESYKKSKETLKRIANWGEQKTSSATSIEQQRDANIGLELGKIFQFQMEEQTKATIKDDADKKLQEVIGFKRHKDQMSALSAIANDTSTLNQYTLKVTSAFQKKSLELQLRSYYVQGYILQEMKRVNAENKTAFGSIIKNTGLPDYVKTRFFERSKEQLRDSLIGGLFGKQQKFVEALGDNIKKVVTEAASNAAMALSMGASGIDLASSMDELSMGRKQTGREKAADIASGFGIDITANKLGKKLHEILGRNEKIALAAKKLGFFNKFGFEAFDKWAMQDRDIKYDEDGNEITTIKDSVADALKNLFRNVRPSKAIDTSFQKDDFSKANEAAIFSSKTNRSIVEIIPGYLARILREISVLRTGDQSIDLIEFDLKSSKFIKSKTKASQILGSIITNSDKESIAYRTERMFNNFFKGENFSEEEKRLFTQFMISQNFKGNFNTVEDLSKTGIYQGTEVEHIADKFTAAFKKSFDVSDEGKMSNTSKAWEKYLEFLEENENLKRSIKDPREAIQKRLDAGDINQLRDLGLLDKDDNLNLNKLKELLTEKTNDTKAASDISLKENIRRFSPKLALNKVKDLGVSLWNYKPSSGYTPGKDFIGPMANDVNRRFGEEAAPDGKKLDLINMNGIALSAIKGLSEELGKIKDETKNVFKGLKDRFSGKSSTREQSNKAFMEMFQNSSPGKRLDEFYANVNKNIADYEASNKIKDGQSQEQTSPKSFQEQVVEILTASRIHLKGIEEQVTQSSLLSLFRMPGLQGAGEQSKELFKKAIKKLDDAKIKESLMDITGFMPDKNTIKGKIQSITKDSMALGKMSLERAYNAFTIISEKQVKAIKSAFGGVANFISPITNKIKAGIKDKATRVVDRFTRGLADIYVEGEENPRILYQKLKDGGYYKSSSGKVLENFADIDDDIMDKDTNVIVLRFTEIDKAYMKDTILQKTVKLKDYLTGQAKAVIDRSNAIRKVFTDFSIKNLKAAGKSIIDMLDEPRDIYVSGEKTPRLLAIMMRGGHYYNRLTGSRIMRPSDIKDEVVDKEGNILISKEDVKRGIVDVNGKEIKTPLQKILGLGKAVIGLGAGFIKNAFQRGTKLFDSVFGGIKGFTLPKFQKLFDGVFGFNEKSNQLLTQIRDILDSRLKSTQEAARSRFTRVRKTKGRQSTTVKGSTDDIIDIEAKTVNKDTTKTLPYENKQLKLPTSTKESSKDTKSSKSTEASAEKPKSKLQMFKDKLKDSKQKLTEKVKSKYEQTLEESDAKRRIGTGPKSYYDGNFFDMIGNTVKSVLGGVLGLFNPLGKGKLGGLGKLAGAAALGTADTAVTGSLLGGSSESEKSPDSGFGIGDMVQNTALGYLGLKGLKGAGSIARFGGQALLGTGRLLGGAGLGAARLGLMGASALAPALGALLANPITLGIVGVGLAGYGAYKGFQWLFKKRFKNIELLRMAQYGFNTGDEEQHQKIFELEKILEKSVKFDEDSNASITRDDFPVEKILSIFGINSDNSEHVDKLFSWLEKRFKPVYLTHMTVYNKVLGKKEIDSVADAKPQQQKDILGMVQMPNGPWDETTSPFPEIKELEVTASMVGKVYEAVRVRIEKELAKDKKEKKEKGLPEDKEYVNKPGSTGVDKAGEAPKTDKPDQANQVPNLQKPKMPSSVGTTIEVQAQAMKSISSQAVTAAEAVRLKAYGLTTMDMYKVRALRMLEQTVARDLKLGDNYTVSWTGDPIKLIESYKAQFEISFDDKEQEGKWLQWFTQRFLPILTAFAAQLIKETGSRDFETAQQTAKAKHLLNAVMAVLNLKDAWRTTASPWTNYRLGVLTEACEENIEFLKKQIKDQNELEEKISKQAAITKKNEAITAIVTPENKKDIYKPEPQAYDAMGNATGITIERQAQKAPIGTEPPEEASTGSTGSAVNASTSTITSSPTKASGDLMTGSGADAFIKLGPNAKLDGIQPELLKLIKGAIEEYGTKTGKSVFITQGFRSFWDQLNLFKKMPENAAKPGLSLHEKGLAIDINSADAEAMEQMGLMKKYGLTRPIGQEPWHVEPAGIQTNIPGFRKDPVSANSAIVAGIGKGGLGWGTEKNASKLTRNHEMAKNLLNASGTEVAQDKSTTGNVNIASTPSTKDANLAQVQTTVPGSANTYNDMPKAENGGYKNMEPTIDATAKATGMDKKFLTGLFGVESNFDPNAKAKTSSAIGLGQMTKSTFEEMKAKYGKQYGIPEDATALDPKANAILSAAYAKENKDAIEKRRGKASDTDVYMSHFLGSGGFKTFDEMKGSDFPASVMKDQAKANYNVFYNKDGSPKTKDQIYQNFDQKLSKYSKLTDTPEEQKPYIQYASFMPKPKATVIESIASPAIEQPPQQTTTVIARALDQVTKVVPKPTMQDNIMASSIDLNNKLTTSMSSIENILSSSLGVQKDILTTLRDGITALTNKAKDTSKDAIDPTTKEPLKKMTSYTPDKSNRPVSEPVVSLSNRMV